MRATIVPVNRIGGGVFGMTADVPHLGPPAVMRARQYNTINLSIR